MKKTAFVFILVLMTIAKVNSQDPLIYQTINEAARAGNLADVTRHLQRGADVNAKDIFGNTPLMGAVYEGNLDLVKFLVAKGADVNAKAKNGWSPLMLAAKNGHMDVANFLVANGAVDENRQAEALAKKVTAQNAEQVQRETIPTGKSMPMPLDELNGGIQTAKEVIASEKKKIKELNTETATIRAEYDKLVKYRKPSPEEIRLLNLTLIDIARERKEHEFTLVVSEEGLEALKTYRKKHFPNER